MSQQMLKVVLVGQTPPPYGGYTVMTAYTLQGEFDGVELHHVPTRFSREMHEIGHLSLRKLVHLAVVVVRIAVTRVRSGATVLYYSPAGPQRVAVYRDLVVLSLTRWMFRRTIFHFHAGGVSDLYPQLNRVLRRLFRRAYYGADVGIRTSVFTPEDPQLLQAKRAVIVPNGIPDQARRWAPPDTEDRGMPTIIFMGVVSESKGVPLMIEAARILKARGLRFIVEVVGDFESSAVEGRIRQFVDVHELSDRVRLRGVLTGNEKHIAQASASVFCLPTSFHSEAFPLVLLEAMQFGVPIVATRWRGIPSIVIDGVNGFLVDVGDPAALADTLAILIENPDLARAMGERGRQMYEERFTLARFHSELREVFDSLRPDAEPSTVPLPHRKSKDRH